MTVIREIPVVQPEDTWVYFLVVSRSDTDERDSCCPAQRRHGCTFGGEQK